MDIRKVEREWARTAPKINKLGEMAKASILGYVQGYMAAKSVAGSKPVEKKKEGS